MSTQRSAIFVYGTLRSATRWHTEFAHCFAEQLGQAKVPGKLYHLLDGWPILVPAEEGFVCGEIFYLRDEASLADLDAYEGCELALGEDSMIARSLKRAILKDDEGVDVWVYYAPAALAHFATQTGILIPEGDWLEWAKIHLRDWRP
ncbi:MAG: gamma-glutamylcyclotransferase family protein [Myxococcota bacterium]|jgi:gamma-glutamylcyclotransferase (GGCT)/AIG2-like uncharacterized protein YtfP|nr:gamma-glutamylcyclotransferase family protein [Myxococcota bacterium]